ncbi:MAG: hypothetical protein ACOX9R_19900 [Armatimonadota bacterium]
MSSYLYEFSRRPQDLWTERHATLVQTRWCARGGQAPIHVLRPGETLDLD